MHELIKKFLIFVIFSILFSQSIPISAQERTVDLDFKTQTLSAKIESAPLRNVIARIKEEKNIWFKYWIKSSEQLLDKLISVRFKGLPFQDGLERILSGLNYSLLYNKNGDLLGVILLGKSPKRTTWNRRPVAAPRRGYHRYRRR